MVRSLDLCVLNTYTYCLILSGNIFFLLYYTSDFLISLILYLFSSYAINIVLNKGFSFCFPFS